MKLPKNKIAPAGVLDSEEHKGCLFWVVGRTSKVADANLVLENSTFEAQIKVSHPAPKKTKHVFLRIAPEMYPHQNKTILSYSGV